MTTWPKLVTSAFALTQPQIHCPANTPILDEFCQDQLASGYFFCSKAEEGHVDLYVTNIKEATGYSVELLTEEYPVLHEWMKWVPQVILEHIPKNEPFKQSLSEVDGEVYLLPDVDYVGSSPDQIDQKMTGIFIEQFIENALQVGTYTDLVDAVSTALRDTNGARFEYLYSILKHKSARDVLFFHDAKIGGAKSTSLMSLLYTVATYNNQPKLLKVLMEHSKFNEIEVVNTDNHALIAGEFQEGLKNAIKNRNIEIVELHLNHPLMKEIGPWHYRHILNDATREWNYNEEIFDQLTSHPNFKIKVNTGGHLDLATGQWISRDETQLGYLLKWAARDGNNALFEKLIEEFGIQEIPKFQFLDILEQAHNLNQNNQVKLKIIRIGSEEDFGVDLVQAIIDANLAKIELHLSNKEGLFELEKEELFIILSILAANSDTKVIKQILVSANPELFSYGDLDGILSSFASNGNADMLDFFINDPKKWGIMVDSITGAIESAVRSEHTALALSLIESPILQGCGSYDSTRMLSEAIKKGNQALIKKFFDLKFHLKIESRHFFSLVMDALEHNNLDLAEKLLNLPKGKNSLKTETDKFLSLKLLAEYQDWPQENLDFLDRFL